MGELTQQKRDRTSTIFDSLNNLRQQNEKRHQKASEIRGLPKTCGGAKHLMYSGLSNQAGARP